MINHYEYLLIKHQKHNMSDTSENSILRQISEIQVQFM